MSKEMRSAILTGDCRRLVLSHGVWNNLDFLVQLNPPIKSILIKSGELDWESINRLPNLESLHIDTSIGVELDCSKLISLKALNCYWDKKNILSVYNCTDLEKLVLWNAKEVDFSRFKCLVALKSLQIVGGAFKSLDGLEELPNLQSLDIGRLTKLENVSALNSMDSLLSLDIDSCNKIQYPKSLSGLNKLKRLSLCRLKKFHSAHIVADCKNLEVLQVFEMSIDDGNLDFIENMPNLKRVIIEPKKHYNFDCQTFEQKLIEKYGEYSVNVDELIGLADYFR